MQQEKYQLRLQVFSNGHFRATKGTPWEGVEETPSFKTLLPRVMKGERVKHHNREYRAV